jgi:glutamyl-tRNA synthetase
MLRFAPSPTGDMHIGNLRVALFNYIVAKQKNEQFIIRIEDIDKAKTIEGKDEEILLILEKFALPHDQRFDQSENLHIHQTLAIRLLEEQKAFVCICTPEQIERDREEAKNSGVAYSYNGRCKDLNNADLVKLKEEKIPFSIRLKSPETPITTLDTIKGKMVAGADEVDSIVILSTNGIPTSNFASACDDMLTGIDYIIRDEKYMQSTPKQSHIKTLLGYETETHYAHLPTILNEGDETSSLRWLLEEGFIPDAILNYLLLLGNKTPQEIFTLPDALAWFNLENISNNPVEFDINKLRYINRQHLKLMDDKKLSSLFGFADADIGKLAKVYLEELSTTKELQSAIGAIFTPKDFTGEWGEQMQVISDIIADAPLFASFAELKKHIINKSGLKEEKLCKPLRYILTGADDGPELSEIYPYIKSYILEIAS